MLTIPVCVKMTKEVNWPRTILPQHSPSPLILSLKVQNIISLCRAALAISAPP